MIFQSSEMQFLTILSHIFGQFSWIYLTRKCRTLRGYEILSEYKVSDKDPTDPEAIGRWWEKSHLEDEGGVL